VSPALRRKAESLLEEGQTLSSFLESVVAEGIESRLSQKQFIDRALAGAAQADRDGSWIPAQDVLAELEARLGPARRSKKRRH
jgi:hypothetical protein